jgi:hypothetical protein
MQFAPSHEYNPVATSDGQENQSMAASGSPSSSDETRETVLNEAAEVKATTLPRGSTTGWKTTTLLFGFYFLGEQF